MTAAVGEVLDAVRTVLGTPSSMISLHEPEFAGHEWDYVKECLDTGWVSSVGSYVDRFERDLAAFTGAGFAVATSNGTAALHAALLIAGVQRDDEVLCPALTFIATANAIAYVPATPHFVDCESTSLGVDAAKVDAYLSRIARINGGVCENAKTGKVIRALVVTHIFGHPADSDALLAVCEKWQLTFVEDAAESLGSYFKGKHTGNVARISALSFNGNKIVTTGGGGAILTNDPVLGKRAKHLTTTARVPHRFMFIHDEVGFNYRLPNLNAALGCAQLERLPSLLERKRTLAMRYKNAFSQTKSAWFLDEPAGTKSNFWLNAIVLDPSLTGHRDEFLAALNDNFFMSRPIWTLMHKLPMYAGCPRMDLDTAEHFEALVINLPSSAKLA